MQFYADVQQYGQAPEASREVAAGYICLALSGAWVATALAVSIAYPAYLETIVLALINAALNFLGFRRIRRKRDPRIAIDGLLLLYFVSIAIVQYRHSSFVAPMVVTLPVMVGMAAAFQRPHMRPATIAIGSLAMTFCLVAALGLIGSPPTHSPHARSVMMFVAVFASMLGLWAVATMSNLARDYAHDMLKTSNDAIIQSAERARSALEAARVGLWDVPNADQQHFHVTESFQTVTGYSGEEFNEIYVNVGKFVHADDITAVRDAFAIGRERMSRIRVDFRLLTKTRGYRWFSARARYVANVDGTIRISGSLQDINVVKVAEEALRAGRDQARAANRAKSDFIGVMSHEVRTPLNAILGGVEVLKRGRHDNESAEMVALIDDAGRGLLAIVNDLLDVSRIDAGKMEIVLVPADLTTVVKRTVDFWGPQAREKGITLSAECDEAAGLPLLMIDAGRVRQIVGNLLSNAIKFTDSGSVKAKVSAFEAEAGRIGIAISVIDTGPGVPGRVAEAIFAPFEQAPGDASRGGAGLGLFISRRLARMMGGDLTLEPARSHGAHFRLTLNAELADPASTSVALPEHELMDWQGLRILCVDDNEKNRRIAELLLGKLGFDVVLCASGAEAIDICAMQQFDLILMDIVMPDMDGIEALRRLRVDKDSRNRSVPALALTAKFAQQDINSYRAAGFDGVAAKPIDVADLAAEITRVLMARSLAIA
jgi:signal transduction histidine kinase/ActR/RegA family two-component response regulator